MELCDDQGFFGQREADLNCSVPLSPLKSPDCLIWSGNNHGCYSMRSAYHIEVSQRDLLQGECSRAKDLVGVWREIWKLEAPAVVKHFVWKMGHNLLWL